MTYAEFWGYAQTLFAWVWNCLYSVTFTFSDGTVLHPVLIIMSIVIASVAMRCLYAMGIFGNAISTATDAVVYGTDEQTRYNSKRYHHDTLEDNYRSWKKNNT